jgi:hypothetical protein
VTAEPTQRQAGAVPRAPAALSLCVEHRSRARRRAAIEQGSTGFPLVWRWATVADPCAPPGTRRIDHPLAGRIGQRCRAATRRGSNGSVLLEFEDGFRVVAPWRAAFRAPVEAAA